MKEFLIRFFNLMAGLFLYALGIAITLKANIGYAPWDVLHTGISKRSGISIGFVSILVGLLVIVIIWILGEKIGFGTICNMIFIGLFLDAILALNAIPLAPNLIISIVMLVLGLFIMALGSYFYIKSAFGAGPRDSIMVALTRKTKFAIGLCRASVEFLVLIGGWALGGMVGLGTVISVFTIGFWIQITFKLFRFDATKVKHETLDETIKSFIALVRR